MGNRLQKIRSRSRFFANVRRWFDAIKVRPAVRRGMDVGKEVRNFGEGISKESLKTMFKQDAKSISEMAKAKEKIKSLE